jgi:ubiquinone/menaquinone biosynthesis C-methylase UbiE
MHLKEILMTTATSDRTEPVTERTRRTYDRVATWYDVQEWLPERLAFRKWRPQLWDLVPDGAVLEIGVGTGKNLRYYREGHSVTAIDFSPKMLERAHRNADRLGIKATLQLMDAQALEFPHFTFDSAVSTFVFCSVPDAVLGLREAYRVLRPGGRVYLLEHVLSERQPARWLMQRLNGLMRAIDGANINRDTVENVELAGFDLVDVQDLWGDIVKLIVAERAA